MVVLPSTYVVGPALAFSAVAALGATLCWIFADALPGRAKRATGSGRAVPRRGPVSPRPAAPPIDDYGLLRAAAYVDDFDTGQSIRALLAAARVRATVAIGKDGLVRVLVFPDEYDRARRLVSWTL